jgi:hypothetical protein
VRHRVPSHFNWTLTSRIVDFTTSPRILDWEGHRPGPGILQKKNLLPLLGLEPLIVQPAAQSLHKVYHIYSSYVFVTKRDRLQVKKKFVK